MFVIGLFSISGRLLVIYIGNGLWWVCGNIEENIELFGGRVVWMIVRFIRGMLIGGVILVRL